MIDLWIPALGFGLITLLAIVLYAIPEAVRRNESAAWGLLVGVVAFLGLSHAGAALLEGNAFLRYEANPWTSALVATAGLLGGIAVGWRLLGSPRSGGDLGARAVLWGAVAFVAFHSFADGLVLGEAYAGPAPTGFTLDVAVVGGTLLHRFAEGSLVVVPAILAAWPPRRVAPWLLLGLASFPAAYVPVAILAPGLFSLRTIALDQGVSVFAAGLEAGFGILFLTLGLLPKLRTAKDTSWAVWAGIGFTLMLLVHFLVE